MRSLPQRASDGTATTVRRAAGRRGGAFGRAAPWSAWHSLRGSMRNHFDHLAKELGQAALGPSGITVVNEPITAETQYADLRYEPDPARQAARDRLGLLGRIASDVCLLEVYSQAPS